MNQKELTKPFMMISYLKKTVLILKKNTLKGFNILTSSFFCLFCDHTEDERVRHYYDDQRHHIHSYHVKQVVSHLMPCRRKEVKGDALGEPLVVRVVFNVKYDTL